jgi:hypothetical protein
MNKKLIFILSMCFTLLLSSCEEDNYAPNLHVQILAGEWIVSGDPYVDSWTLTTSNTNDNSTNGLLLTDKESFWYFTVTVPAEPWNPSFGQKEVVTNQYYEVSGTEIVPYDIKVIVKNGIVTPNAVTLPSGWKADKIAFTLAFEDDGYTEYRIVGYRVSGFLEDIGYVYYEE